MPRLRWIDLFRGLAVIGMIATHVAGAFLANSWKEGGVWNSFNIGFGFVAPAFLLCSGLTLWGALQRRMDAPETEGKRGAQSLLRRAALLLLLGYWLQIPVLSLRQLIWRHDPTELARLFDTNVLQVIAVAMGAIVLLALVVRPLVSVAWVAAALAVAIIIGTPWVWASDSAAGLFLPLRSYFLAQPDATFSLFPHAAYLLTGFASAPLLLKPRRYQWVVPALFAATFFAAEALLAETIGGIPPHDRYWHGSIQHTCFRLAVLFATISALKAITQLLEQQRETRLATRAASKVERRKGGAVEEIGKRSLGIYVLHLMLLYGSPVNMGMIGWLDGRFRNAWDPLACLLLALSVAALCYGALLFWEWLRKAYPTAARWAKRLWWWVFWALFLLVP